MYLKKINLKAFEDYLKNPTDPFLEGNICITDGVVKYFRFVRTPASKGEHDVEILYGGAQITYHSGCCMRDKKFSSDAPLDFMAYVVDGETLYSQQGPQRIVPHNQSGYKRRAVACCCRRRVGGIS